MHQQQFPRSALMFGCAPLGGLYHQPIEFKQAQEVLIRVVKHHNIHDIDTAPWYGHGKAESDLGKVIADTRTQHILEKEQIRIYTKAGRVMKPRSECTEDDPRCAMGDTCYAVTAENKDVVPYHDYTAEGIRESVRQSIHRLKLIDTDDDPKSTQVRNPLHRIVSLRLHDCDEPDRFKQATEQGGINELFKQCNENIPKKLYSQQQQQQECVASLGMNVPEYILKILKWSSTIQNTAPASLFKTILMAGAWNLMDQSGLVVMEYCEMYQIQIHNAGIFGGGLLWGGKNNRNYRYRRANEEEMEKRDRWNEVAVELGVSLPALAFAFAYLPLPVSVVCFGANSVKQLDACVAAADESMKVDLVQMIRLGEKKGLFIDQPGVASKCLEWIGKKKGRDFVYKSEVMMKPVVSSKL